MDKIAYTENWNEFKKLLEGDDVIEFTHTPFKIKGNKAMALVRGDIPDELTALGTYDEIFADPALDAKYKAIYPYDVEIKYTDGEGNIISYYPPQQIGVFA